MGKNYKEEVLKAIRSGITMDFCGLTDRDYFYGVYSDYCGFDFNSVIEEPTGETKKTINLVIKKTGSTLQVTPSSSVNSDIELTINLKRVQSGNIISKVVVIKIPKETSKPIEQTLDYEDYVIDSATVNPISDNTYKYVPMFESDNDKCYYFMYKKSDKPNDYSIYINNSGVSFQIKETEQSFKFQIPPEEYTKDYDADELTRYIEDNELYYVICFAINSKVNDFKITEDCVDKRSNFIEESPVKIGESIYNIYSFGNIDFSNLYYTGQKSIEMNFYLEINKI